MLKKYAGKIMLCAAFTILVSGPAFAKDKEKTKSVKPNAQRVSLAESYSAIFGGDNSTEAKCTADCGDGSGWECTGESVYCEDGLGCTASSGGYEPVYGICEN